jgi:hypothetical protein
MRTLHREPRLLVGEAVRLEENVPLRVLERRAAGARHRKAAHAHRAVHRLAGREVRRPAPVIERVGRRDLDVVHHSEPVRHDPRVGLGPADDLGAVALDDDEDPHWMPAR